MYEVPLSEYGCKWNLGAEVSNAIDEWKKVMGALRTVWKERSFSGRAKMGMFEGIVFLIGVVWLQSTGENEFDGNEMFEESWSAK